MELELRHGEWTVPIGGAVASDGHLRLSKPDRSSLIIRVPYVTNAAALSAGSVVCASPNAHTMQIVTKAVQLLLRRTSRCINEGCGLASMFEPDTEACGSGEKLLFPVHTSWCRC